jgi:predicted DNA-binding transcriptional regulator YafY
VLGVEALAAPFPRPANLDALAAVAAALAVVPYPWRLEVWLGTTLEEARHQTGLSAAYFEEADDGVLLRVGSDDLDFAARFLARLGVPLVVSQPPELRPMLRDHALARDAERS